MKTNNFLWATLATAILTLTGCSSDDNELTVPQPQDKTALLELRLIGNGINTKATGDNLPTQAEENTVKHFTVAIFNSDNTVNALHTVTENTTSATTISCTPATNCTGIVVANAPSDSYFTGVLNKDDFLKKTIALADAQTKDCLPMSGNIKDKNGNATFTLSAGDNDGITAQLSRLVARVSISSIKTDFDPQRAVLSSNVRVEKHLCPKCNKRNDTGHRRIQHNENGNPCLPKRKLRQIQRNSRLSGKCDKPCCGCKN